MRARLVKLLIAFIPLLLTPLLGLLIAEGLLNLGGGEKDLLLLIPWLLWSLLFLVAYLFFWWRGLTVGKSSAYALLVPTLLLLVAWITLYLFSVLGLVR
jgi:hypothetical protein